MESIQICTRECPGSKGRSRGIGMEALAALGAEWHTGRPPITSALLTTTQPLPMNNGCQSYLYTCLQLHTTTDLLDLLPTVPANTSTLAEACCQVKPAAHIQTHNCLKYQTCNCPCHNPLVVTHLRELLVNRDGTLVAVSVDTHRAVHKSTQELCCYNLPQPPLL